MISWPEKTAHGQASLFAGLVGTGEWRAPRSPDRDPLEALQRELAEKGRAKLNRDEHQSGGPEIWRTCPYCGSMHPGDLADLIELGAVTKIGGSDWKYGWPHKFYVDVANPDPDTLWLCSSSGGGPCMDCRSEIHAAEPYTRGGAPSRPQREWPAPDPDCSWCEGSGANPSHISSKGDYSPFTTYPTLHGKFYTEHLAELDDDALEYLAGLLAPRTGIHFFRTAQNERLRYSAPYAGYQA